VVRFAVLAVLALALPARAQEPGPLSPAGTARSGERTRLALTSAGARTDSPPARIRAGGGLTRWLDLQTCTLYLRARFIENSSGVVTARHAQHKEAVRARLKFDAAGDYALNVGLFTGRTFTSSWNTTGWGGSVHSVGSPTGRTDDDAQRVVFLKQLFLAARPVRGLELQYGGLYVLRGESTEITTYDEDAFIVGARGSVRRPDRFFVDEVSLTLAHLGDANTPNVLRRLRRLDTVSYRHLLVGKRVADRLGVSVDYTSQTGRRTVREAISLALPGFRVLDLVRVENYQRIRGQQASGFAAWAEKRVCRGLMLGGGYGRIDPNHGGLNADRHNIGNRLFGVATYTAPSGLSVQAYATRAVGTSFATPLRIRADLVVSYNLLRTIQQVPWLRPVP
jgi:hypothetical protein